MDACPPIPIQWTGPLDADKSPLICDSNCGQALDPNSHASRCDAFWLWASHSSLHSTGAIHPRQSHPHRLRGGTCRVSVEWCAPPYLLRPHWQFVLHLRPVSDWPVPGKCGEPISTIWMCICVAGMHLYLKDGAVVVFRCPVQSGPRRLEPR